MKCSACAKDECRGNYENRQMCAGQKEGIKCSCYCSRTKSEVFLSSALSIGTGVTVAAAGVGLAVATGGVAGIILGPALASAGASLITSPIQKLTDKECVTFTDSAIDEGLGASIGIVNDSLGPFGPIVTKGANAAVSLGAKVIARTTADARSTAICEGAKFIKGEKVSMESLVNSMAIGAIADGVDSISTPIEHSNDCNPIVDEIGDPATVQASTLMATENKRKKKFRIFSKFLN